MPIPLDKIQVVEDQIERLDDHRTIVPPEQGFSFLSRPLHNKRTVHYDIEPIHDDEDRPLKAISPIPPSPSIDHVLRRRYIAHWGLPGRGKQL